MLCSLMVQLSEKLVKTSAGQWLETAFLIIWCIMVFKWGVRKEARAAQSWILVLLHTEPWILKEILCYLEIYPSIV